MKKKYKSRFSPLGIVIGVLVLSMVAYLGFKTTGNEFKIYTSQDLKISFQYPKKWYIDEKDYSVLLTSYKTFIGENKHPTGEQIRIDIDPISLCQSSIERNLIYGGCGENQKVLNEILNKKIKTTLYGTLITFTVKYPDNTQKTIHYLQKGDKILQISKKPYPSEFEKEFESIVNSIEFK